MRRPASTAVTWTLSATSFPLVADVVAALRAQTLAADLELVLALPAGEPEPDLSGLGAVTVLRVPDPFDLPRVRAAAIRAARSSVIVFGETHCLPEPGCAAALARAYADGVVSVGPLIRNANPQTWRSWAAFLIDYGRWAEPWPPGPIAELPNHNASFARTALIGWAERLEALLEDDTRLSLELASRGELRFEPRALARHLNISRWCPWFHERFIVGRAFAGRRRAGWPLWRGIVYALGSPLIPLIRFARISPHARSVGAPAAALPTMLLALCVSALGEAVGYAAGDGGAVASWRKTELLKGTCVRPGEARAALEAIA